MKKLLLLTLALCLTFGLALAQEPGVPDSLCFGNPANPNLTVGIGAPIQVPVFVWTDDDVDFIHMPLASDNAIIASRDNPPGPTNFGYPLNQWAVHLFLAAEPNTGGRTNQSILGFMDTGSGPTLPMNTGGAWTQVATYLMTTVFDTTFIGTTVCPFSEGLNPANGGQLWGIGGTINVFPVTRYACLYFSPNQDPSFTDCPATVNSNGAAVTVNIAGTDSDAADDVSLTQTAGPGTLNVTADGLARPITGTWSFTPPVGPGTYVAEFLLDDGNLGTATCAVTVTVTPGELSHNPVLTVGYVEGQCLGAVPGADVWVPIKLYAEGYCGGVDILIQTDPTVLTAFEVAYDGRINGGSEYHQWTHNAEGAGTDRVVWIADVNNGMYTPPALPGDGPILWVHYQVASGDFLFDVEVPINFMITDFRDNTISDETGYEFIHPRLAAGCVHIQNPASFKGDPNMNCELYEIADAVLVARRLIEGTSAWVGDESMANIAPCDRHYAGNDAVQEASADLNNNHYVDVADLVRFINILNGIVEPPPPKVDPGSYNVSVAMDNNAVKINSGIEIGGVLVQINHTGEISAPVASNGMQILSHDANGVLSVLVYSLEGNRVAAGTQTLFTISGDGMTLGQVSSSDSYGTLLPTAVREISPIPTSYSVSQNYPNPFNAKTRISFALPQDGDVAINIYSITGQLVETLNGKYTAGEHSIMWDASDVASGVYFYKLSAGSYSQTMKMTLLK
jgi:hypothetical protein